MRIVIIGGLPCSGKSKLAERLVSKAALPLLSKDEYKELLFDALGVKDRAWSRRLSEAAYALMFKQAAQFVAADCVFVMEGNFREHQHREKFAALASAGAQIVQVHCRAETEILVSRFNERSRSGLRHAGHADVESLPEIENELRTARQEPLSIHGELIVCDTTEDWSEAIDSAVAKTIEYLEQNE